MHENMAFVIGKLNFVSYQFVLRHFPHLDPRNPLDYEMSQHTSTTYVKAIVGLGEGAGLKKKA